MNHLGLNEIREKYLSFFESKGHLRMPSFSLVPKNDNSLLLINSGMAPLKAYFTGLEKPPCDRVTTCQKCIRTGDIENVGKTARHGTFFEMLGNFSFGDYFKEEIIPWSWEFFTEYMGFDPERLFVSVYEDDDEAFDIWNKKVGLPKEKIFRMGKADNFWEHGLGPCGPCSEIYFDRGEKYGCGSPDCTVGCECDRFIEIWNLVFTQFNKNEDGTYSKLARPNIDTGMGLERIAAVMQDVGSIFDVDTIKAVRDKVCTIAGVKYNDSPKKDISIRIITDHIRSVTFMTADGVLPSNEGRGYVLRRLLRRAARHGKLLGIGEMFLTDLSGEVINVSKEAYPELVDKKDYIFKVLSVEEKRFYETIDQGTEILKGFIKKLTQGGLNKMLSGSEAFKLYDTYGFPLDLMKEILEEAGFGVDEDGFQGEMKAQRERGRAAREESTFMGAKETVFDKLEAGAKTEFVGYDTLATDNAVIVSLIADNNITDKAEEGDSVALIVDKTPFYAESGGQKGDKGHIVTNSGTIEVTDCIKISGDRFAHIGKVEKGFVSSGDSVKAEVSKVTRMSTARNHTATHLLQKALREVIGTHVEQAGSSVSEDRLRFDFTHFEAISKEHLAAIEAIVNEKILEAIDVNVAVKPIDEARELGAMALFGEKYGDYVRVVNIEGYSIEFCGGTHVSNTSQIGVFKILSESGIASGVRRIEAVTGKGALEYFKKIDEVVSVISSISRASADHIISRVESLLFSEKQFAKEIERLKEQLSSGVINDILLAKKSINGVNTITAKISGADINRLKSIGDKLRDKLNSGVIVLASDNGDKADIVVMATDDTVKKGIHAGNIIKSIAPLIGGNGGGRPNVAQAGGKDTAKIEEALNKAAEVISEQYKA